MKKSCSVLLALAFAVGISAQSMAASVGGTVGGPQGQLLNGIQIIVKDASGHVVAQGSPGPTGGYDITGLPEGNYTFTLDPGPSGVQGQTVSSYVGADGICLNWGVSTTSPAVATAQPGSTCQGVAGAWWDDPSTYVGVGAALIAAGVIAAVVVNQNTGGSNHHTKKTNSVLE